MVCGSNHHKVTDRAAGQFFAVEVGNPCPHNQAARRVRDAREAFTCCKAWHDLLSNGGFHGTRHIIKHHLVRKADVFGQVEVLNVQAKLSARVAGQCFRQSGIGIGVGGTPAMDKNNSHAFLPKNELSA